MYNLMWLSTAVVLKRFDRRRCYPFVTAMMAVFSRHAVYNDNSNDNDNDSKEITPFLPFPVGQSVSLVSLRHNQSFLTVHARLN